MRVRIIVDFFARFLHNSFSVSQSWQIFRFRRLPQLIHKISPNKKTVLIFGNIRGSPVPGTSFAFLIVGGKMGSVRDLQQAWYVVYSKPHQEEQAQFHLRLKQVEVFLPRLDLPGSFRRKQRFVPLFPNYLFVRIHLASQSQYVIWSPGVKRFVHFGDTPIPLEDETVNLLKQQADSAGVIKARSRLKPGQEVEVQEGPFAGLLGIIQEPPDDKGRVKVLLTLLSRQIRVELRAQFLKVEWAPYGPTGAVDRTSGVSLG